MIGLDTFREFFRDYTDSYIIIGGAACVDYFAGEEFEFRATKDIDMVLVVETVSNEFIAHFWKFIKKGQYERNEKSDNRQYYRFVNPMVADFPVQVELFGRTPDLIAPRNSAHFTIIPTNEDLSSLSAILMDDEYYHFTLEHRTTDNFLTRADKLALICLKARAFLDLSKRKQDGQRIDSKTIKKHRSDVFRLAATLTLEDQLKLPEIVKKDMEAFMNVIEADPPPTKDFLKEMGITNVSTEQLIEQLKFSFSLDGEQ